MPGLELYRCLSTERRKEIMMTDTMKAIRQHAFGSPEVLVYEDVSIGVQI